MEMPAAVRRCVGEVAARLATGGDGPQPLLVDDVDDEAWRRLVGAFGLDSVDLSLLVVAAAAAFDERIAAIFATATPPAAGWPTVATAIRLAGADPLDPVVRARLSGMAPLLRSGLLHVGDGQLPFPQRPVSVDDRVAAHLSGDDRLDPALEGMVAPLIAMASQAADRMAKAVGSGQWLFWVREGARASGFSMAAAAVEQLGATALGIDLARGAGCDLASTAVAALREAALSGSALVIGPIDPERDATALRQMDDPPCPVIMVSRQSWRPRMDGGIPFLLDAEEPRADERARLWRGALERLGHRGLAGDDLGRYRLTAEQIVVAAASAAVQAAGAQPTVDDLLAAARAHNSGQMEQLVRHVEPKAGFESLVVSPVQRADLQQVIDRYRTVELVQGDWGAGGAHAGRGVTALFHGPSGTGKTLSAEVIARELGVDLFVVDLSQVVDKYIGETEKNLERVFSAAENVNGVLFFDEADALFGKRSEVKDAHDRHANVEVAYLLERMERFEGVAVLATNLQGNMDEAFTRRLDVVCDFAEPGEEQRRELWRLHLPPTMPQDDDIDLDLLARALEASGGTIRNITLAAAYGAAAGGHKVRMVDLVVAATENFRKRGRLLQSPELAAHLTSA